MGGAFVMQLRTPGVMLLQAMLSPDALAGMGTALDAALAAEEMIEAAEARKLARRWMLPKPCG